METDILKEKCGKLTDDDLDQIDGNTDILNGRLQEPYGYSKEKARKEIDSFTGSLN